MWDNLPGQFNGTSYKLLIKAKRWDDGWLLRAHNFIFPRSNYLAEELPSTHYPVCVGCLGRELWARLKSVNRSRGWVRTWQPAGHMLPQTEIRTFSLWLTFLFHAYSYALTALGKKDKEVFWLQISFEVCSGLCIQLLTELEDKWPSRPWTPASTITAWTLIIVGYCQGTREERKEILELDQAMFSWLFRHLDINVINWFWEFWSVANKLTYW